MPRVYRALLEHFPVWAVVAADGACAVYDSDGRLVDHHLDVSSGPQHAGGLPNRVSFRYVERWTECALGIGEHHPRIWRGDGSPGRREYAREWGASYGAVNSLVRRMAEVFHFIEPTQENAGAYGHETRQLLIVAAAEVESSFRAILSANAYVPPNGNASRLSTNDFIKLAEPMRLREWGVKLAVHADMGPLAPFRAWDATNPTTSLGWYDAYNAAKHDRERNFSRATVANAVMAVAAAYILVIAQFGEFDNRHFLGIDEFRQIEAPEFEPAQVYIPPKVGGMTDGWKEKPLFAKPRD